MIHELLGPTFRGEAAFPGGLGTTAGADCVSPAGGKVKGFFLSLMPGSRLFLVTRPAAADMALIGKNKHPGKKKKKK